MPTTVLIGRRVLFLGAHADDIEIGCGGTAAKCAAAGRAVAFAQAADCGRDRRREAQDAAGLLNLSVEGGTLFFGPIPDGRLEERKDVLRNWLADVTERFQPDTVFVHRPDDTHPDHVALHEAVIRGLVHQTLLLYPIPKLAAQSTPFDPNYWEDISEYFESKLRLCACHVSQAGKGIYLDPEHLRSLARVTYLSGFGRTGGYAEPFRIQVARSAAQDQLLDEAKGEAAALTPTGETETPKAGEPTSSPPSARRTEAAKSGGVTVNVGHVDRLIGQQTIHGDQTNYFGSPPKAEKAKRRQKEAKPAARETEPVPAPPSPTPPAKVSLQIGTAYGPTFANVEGDVHFHAPEGNRRPEAALPGPQPGSPPPPPPPAPPDQPSEAEVIELLSALRSLKMEDYQVVGHYFRFQQSVFLNLRRAAQKIVRDCRGGGGLYHNFLVWGSSGQGKTYFVTETAAAAGIESRRISLASPTDVPDESALRRHLAESQGKRGPFLFIVDEVDKRNEPWICSALFDSLSSRPANPEGNTVFVLVGSTGQSLDDFWKGMEEHKGGKDLRTRIPTDQTIMIPKTMLGDRLLVVLGQMRSQAGQKACRVEMIDKLALAYVLLSPAGMTPRGIGQLVAKAVGRLAATDTEIRYGHLFDPGDDDSAGFINRHAKVYNALNDDSLRLV